MKIQLFIAVRDSDYMEHLSRVLLSKHADSFEVSVCSSLELFSDMMERHIYDVAILDADFFDAVGNVSVHLPLLLWSGSENVSVQTKGIKKLRKYQRISEIVRQILAWYAEISDQGQKFGDKDARITVIWSPIGGSGKTTTALAYAAYLTGQGKKTVYLDLEPFSSSPAYFGGQGPGLSDIFEKIQDGNVGLMLKSIRMEDSESGIFYFNRPNNYEDIAILTAEDISVLIRGAATGADEVIADLGSAFDAKIRQAMELSDQILLVTDSSPVSQVKYEQFRAQHSLYGQITDKLTIVANRGASHSVIADENINVIVLPVVQSQKPSVVYKTLSGYFRQLAGKK